MSKAEVEEKRLGEYVVMPSGTETAFKTWWRLLVHLHTYQSDIHGEFNRAQTEAGRGTCSNGSSHNWLKAQWLKVAVCPHQEDYCDTHARTKRKLEQSTQPLTG